MSEQETFVAEDLCACPFCGGKLATSLPGEENPFILHSSPTCAKFDALEPDVFLRAVRERRAG